MLHIYLHFNVAIDAYVIWVWIDVNINSSREIRYGKDKSTDGQKWEEEAVDGSSAPISWKQITARNYNIFCIKLKLFKISCLSSQQETSFFQKKIQKNWLGASGQ